MSAIKKAFRNWNFYRGAVAAFLLVCILISVFCFEYYHHLQQTIREESSGYLQEVSRRIGSNINRAINDGYAVLNTMVGTIQNTQAETFQDVQPLVEMQQRYWNYEDILLIDEDGMAYNTQGKEVALNSDVYLLDAVIKKEQSMSTAQVVNNQEYIIFAVPTDGITLDGKEIMALAACYSPTAFSDMLSMSSFDGQAYSHIINKDGSIVIRSTSANAIKAGYNVLATISGAQMTANNSMEQLREDIVNNRDGQVEFTLDDNHSYMVYTAIDPEDWYLLTFVPVEIVNAKSNLMLELTLLISGLITLGFAGLIAFLFYVFNRNNRKLEQIAYVDPVTGGHTIQKFYKLVKEALEIPCHPSYALVYTNIEKFKLFNQQFGQTEADNILRAFYDTVVQELSGRECIGRLSADNFCMLVEYDDEEVLITRWRRWYFSAEDYVRENQMVWSLPMTAFGVYHIEDISVPVPQMIDRAKLALKGRLSPITNRLGYAIYDDEISHRLIRDKQLEDRMEQALRDGEFQAYLQPKYRTDDGCIGGAEALSRWISPTEGMIYPDEFIPLFERNGFVIQLDLWVFEEVCRMLRRWLDEGRKPVKISVNCSRIHLYNPDFLENYLEITRRHRVPEPLIELELTESIVMEDTEYLIRVIDKIHAAGFACSMDDFGSAYSSLNLLQDIYVDVLKLDRIFFRDSGRDSSRGASVVGNIVGMAKALQMETVAEGVERGDQVEMLHKLGCDYIQGYVFAKPMPVEAFERLLFGEKS